MIWMPFGTVMNSCFSVRYVCLALTTTVNFLNFVRCRKEKL